jgi:hypothetical protein
MRRIECWLTNMKHPKDPNIKDSIQSQKNT